MTQKEFIKAVTVDVNKKVETKISEHNVGEVIKSVVTVTTETLAKGEQIQLAGFGTFCTVDKPAREGRNPATGQAMHIPAKVTPKFKPGKSLKDIVAGNKK